MTAEQAVYKLHEQAKSTIEGGHSSIERETCNNQCLLAIKWVASIDPLTNVVSHYMCH